jgi:hypothetical protein
LIFQPVLVDENIMAVIVFGTIRRRAVALTQKLLKVGNSVRLIEKSMKIKRRRVWRGGARWGVLLVNGWMLLDEG